MSITHLSYRGGFAKVFWVTLCDNAIGKKSLLVAYAMNARCIFVVSSRRILWCDFGFISKIA